METKRDFIWKMGGQQGQGVESCGEILGRVLAQEGYSLFSQRLFASRIKGGHTTIALRIAADHRVATIGESVDCLVALDQETIDKIDPMIAAKMGFKECYPVSGQTYSRKVDTRVANVLAGIAASAHKMSNDIRLLQHLKEVEEPFEKNQIGSSAMAYKRNPMRSERIASLSRYVMVDALNPAITSATQWFERTLDDSANKRLSIPEGFLAIDGILDLCLNVVDGLVVYPKVIEKHMMSELPFMATENIMMDAVKLGGNRQELHERIRELSMEAGRNVKVEGKENNLLELIAADPAFPMGLEELKASMDPSKYIGRSKEQVEAFLKNVIHPILEANKDLLGVKAEINV